MKRSPLESVDGDIGDEPVPWGWLMITVCGILVGAFWWVVIAAWCSP